MALTAEQKIKDVIRLLGINEILTLNPTQNELQDRVDALFNSFIGPITQENLDRFRDQTTIIISLLINEAYGWKARALTEFKRNK